MSEDVSSPAVDVAAIRAALDKATPGPWEQNGRNGIHTRVGACVALSYVHDDARRKADAELIVLLRNNAEALLRMLDDGYCAGYDHGVEDQMDRQEAALAEAERRGAVKALLSARDAWQWGQWADAPRCPDRVQERIANAQHVTDWLTARADAIERGEVSP